jgi:four helix bundle protein
MKENVIQKKSYDFALRMVDVYKRLSNDHKEFILSKQLLRSSTSIGANIEEAIGAQSKSDFIAKMTIAYKEARETKYWVNLLIDSGFLNKDIGNSLLSDNEELMRIIGSIQKTTKAKHLT